jgi:hypothetical protein
MWQELGSIITKVTHVSMTIFKAAMNPITRLALGFKLISILIIEYWKGLMGALQGEEYKLMWKPTFDFLHMSTHLNAQHCAVWNSRS